MKKWEGGGINSFIFCMFHLLNCGHTGALPWKVLWKKTTPALNCEKFLTLAVSLAEPFGVRRLLNNAGGGTNTKIHMYTQTRTCMHTSFSFRWLNSLPRLWPGQAVVEDNIVGTQASYPDTHAELWKGKDWNFEWKKITEQWCYLFLLHSLRCGHGGAVYRIYRTNQLQ